MKISRLELATLWLFALLTPCALVVEYGQTSSSLALVRGQIKEVAAKSLTHTDTTAAEIREQLGGIAHTIAALDGALGTTKLENNAAADALRQELDKTALQLLSLLQRLDGQASQLKDGADESKKLHEEITKQAEAITSLSNQIPKPDELIHQAKHYLLTQVRVNNVGHGSGSGTVLAGNYVITAQHVIEGSTDVEVYVHREDGTDQMFPAHVLASDEAKDMAILSVIAKESLPCVSIMKKQAIMDMPLLSKVYVVGFPLRCGPYFTEGLLVNKQEDMTAYKDGWMINANIWFGSSGGGVFDAKSGELVGMPVAIKCMGANAVSFMACVVPGHRIIEWLESKNIKCQ